MTCTWHAWARIKTRPGIPVPATVPGG